MCKEMPVIQVNKVVDPKRTIAQDATTAESRGGGEAQGVADPPPPKKKCLLYSLHYIFVCFVLYYIVYRYLTYELTVQQSLQGLFGRLR
jgi:hypothetical protein